jgi:Domain of unknown function (DUF4398)
MNHNTQPVSRTGLLFILAASLPFMGVACASTPPAPTAALQAAQQAIVVAEREQAGQFAPGELGDARARLASANKAVETKNMVVAERLALQSRAAAELSTAKTASIKAAAINADMVRSNAILVEEMNRKAGAK